jgi:hypothetical protein
MLAATLASVALLPGLLSPTLDEVRPKTSLPILLPDRITTEFDELHASGKGSRNRYAFDLGAVPDCGGATACFAASFSARKGGKPRGPRTATLIRGRKGRFTPLRCGASCSPPSISWKERGVVYTIQARVGTQRTERRLLIKLANEAIRRGPR